MNLFAVILIGGIIAAYYFNLGGFKQWIEALLRGGSNGGGTYTESICLKPHPFGYEGPPTDNHIIKAVMLMALSMCEINRMKGLSFTQIDACGDAKYQQWMATHVDPAAQQLTFDQLYNKQPMAMSAAITMANQYISMCGF